MGDRPLRATRHCRHYSYDKGAFLSGCGARCAKGVDLSEPGSIGRCMPDPTTRKSYSGPCPQREDYTGDERAEWTAWIDGRMARIPVAVAALGDPMPLRSERTVDCPFCAGRLSASRAGNGHVWLACATPDCFGPMHFNIRRETEWP